MSGSIINWKENFPLRDLTSQEKGEAERQEKAIKYLLQYF